LEIDETGKPTREIGFDADMQPVVLGPIGRNFGFLVDSSDDWTSSHEDSSEAASEFQKRWEQLWPRFRHLENENSQPVAGDNAG
jgi:hypothetical protein